MVSAAAIWMSPGMGRSRVVALRQLPGSAIQMLEPESCLDGSLVWDGASMAI